MNINTPQSPLPPKNKALKKISLILLVILIYIPFHLFEYGARLSFCPFTDEVINVNIPSSAKLVLERDVYVFVGKDKVLCSPLLKNINLQIQQTAEYDLNGRSPKILKSGEVFTIEEAIVVEQHGFKESFGYDTYYLLKDEKGSIYKIHQNALTDLDQSAPAYFGYYNNGKRIRDANIDFSVNN